MSCKLCDQQRLQYIETRRATRDTLSRRLVEWYNGSASFWLQHFYCELFSYNDVAASCKDKYEARPLQTPHILTANIEQNPHIRSDESRREILPRHANHTARDSIFCDDGWNLAGNRHPKDR